MPSIRFRVAALRELFEETGVLLSSCHNSNGDINCTSFELNEVRREVILHPESFLEFFTDSGIFPDTASLLPFARWYRRYSYYNPTLLFDHQL